MAQPNGLNTVHKSVERANLYLRNVRVHKFEAKSNLDLNNVHSFAARCNLQLDNLLKSVGRYNLDLHYVHKSAAWSNLDLHNVHKFAAQCNLVLHKVHKSVALAQRKSMIISYFQILPNDMSKYCRKFNIKY